MNRQTRNTTMKAVVLLIGSITALVLTVIARGICPQITWLWTILGIILLVTTGLTIWILIHQWRHRE